MKRVFFGAAKITAALFTLLFVFAGFLWNSKTSANNKPEPESQTTSTVPVSGQPISAYGDFFVLVSEDTDPKTGAFKGTKSYQVVIDGVRYPAKVPANTRRSYSKLNIPIQGTLDNGTIILDEAPFKKLDSSGYALKNIDTERLGSYGLAAEIGGAIEYFHDPLEFNSRLQEEIKWESALGPEKTRAPMSADALTSTWTEGTKTLLFIRLDFSDDPGVPTGTFGAMTDQAVLSYMNNQVSPFYVANSYNKTSIQTTVTPVVRMPHPKTYYSQNNRWEQVLTDGRDAARAAGYETNNFTFDLVGFNDGISGVCLAAGNTACTMINSRGIFLPASTFTASVIAHELGHNYGLDHANLWLTTDGSPTGAGTLQEYGDAYDVMGSGEVPTKHFNGSYKRLLGWLTDSNVRTVTSDGTYQIFSQDNSGEGGIRALKIKKDATKDYWITHREATTNPAFINGAQFHWRFNTGTSRSLMLDMHDPRDGNGNSPLGLGESFLDSPEGIRYTVLNNGSLPEKLSVKVEYNAGCTYNNVVPASESFSAGGGGGTIVLQSSEVCNPPATDSSKWIQVIGSKPDVNDFGVSLVDVNYIVLPNYAAEARTGTITVAGHTVTIQQSAAATVCVTSPAGLVAWWTGDGHGLDQTTNNAGLVGNVKDSFGGGKIGGAFRTADLYVSSTDPVMFVPDAPPLALTQSLSIEGWIKRNNDIYLIGSIIRRSPDGHDLLPPSYSVDVVAGHLVFQINGTSNGSNNVSISNSTLLPNTFVHFAATLDDATGAMKLYINGAVVSQTTTAIRPFSTIPSTGGIVIGAGSGEFDYSMDELSIYNRSLSVSEIQSIYNAGTAPTGAAGKCPLNNVNKIIDKTPFDFDGDRRSDLSIFSRVSTNAVWQTLGTQNGYLETALGLSTDKPVPADYDNDGRTDAAVFRNGTWYLQQSSMGAAQFNWGLAGDIPQPADFNGDGRADPAVFRPSNGTWYWLNLVNNQYNQVQFGVSGDKPAVGDYDGDGAADYAVYRPSEGIWYLLQSNNGFAAAQFGVAADQPVPADYDGDSKIDIAVFRPSTGVWYILRSSDLGVTSKLLGQASDYPAPADYDGDGKADITVWRPGTGFKTGEWSIIQSRTDQLRIEYFGNTGDTAVPSAFNN
jgi:hypothetical protein